MYQARTTSSCLAKVVCMGISILVGKRAGGEGGGQTLGRQRPASSSPVRPRAAGRSASAGLQDQETGFDLLDDEVDLVPVLLGRRQHHGRLAIVELLEPAVDEGDEGVVGSDLG